METRTDALTVAEMKAADPNFEGARIREVQRHNDGWSITRENGWGNFISDEDNPNGIEPKVGDMCRVYGSIGRPIYGIDINGEEVFWLTPLEREARRSALLAKWDREKCERYEKERPINDAKIANLPEPLRIRMERFRKQDDDGDSRLSESYEIFCCEQAAWLAETLRPKLARMSAKDAVEWFRGLKYEQQTEMGMSDQHSGNTFGGMCGLAFALLEGRNV